eukprot:10350506-Alexandrium_andersonii.AAC.1
MPGREGRRPWRSDTQHRHRWHQSHLARRQARQEQGQCVGKARHELRAPGCGIGRSVPGEAQTPARAPAQAPCSH